MLFGDFVPGVPNSGIYPLTNDLNAMSLARLDGKCGRTFYEYYFIKETSDFMTR